MRAFGRPGAALVGVLLCACGGSETADLETFTDSASYAIGMNMASSLAPVRERVAVDALLQGVEDALTDGEPPFTQQDAMRILQQFTTESREAEMQSQSGLVETNRAEGDAYREQNGQRPGVTTTASGLQYEVLTESTGAQPAATDRVTVHYKGTSIDGTVFDSSYDRNEPATFPLDGVIAGWTEGVQLMSIGSKYRFVLPPELGYGERGAAPDIGPAATLVFEVELLEIER